MKEKWVFNLSDGTLNETERSTLSLGLNFAIVPKKLQTSQIVLSIEQGI